MKANIPNRPTEDATPPKRTPAMELGGVYLRAMQDVSARLMEALPAEDSLWQTLAQTESLLLEAQLSEASLQDVFGSGGVAGFCQSIVDEYNQKRAGEARDVPAAHDPSLRRSRKNPEPRGGITLYRKRKATASLIALFALIFAVLAVWYTGLLGFWIKGSRYYLDELYHFSDTVTPVSDQPVRFTVPLEPATGLEHVLYTDADSDALLVLTEIFCTERLHEVESDTSSDEDGQPTYQKSLAWCVSIRYPVNVGYMRISYIEPGTSGEATLTLADGTVITSTVSASRSGPCGQGLEYIALEMMDLPASTDTEGAILSVTLDPPRAVEWKRIGVGLR